MSSGRRTTRSSAARCGAFPSHGSWSTWWRWTDHGCSGSNGTESSSLTAHRLNDYIGERLGDHFTAKDFRTWGGTLVAASELARHGPAQSERDAKRVLGLVMRKVARELGNTAAVACESYVSPAVVDAYLEGRTLEDYRGAARAAPARMSVDERALLRLLRAASRGD